MLRRSAAGLLVAAACGALGCGEEAAAPADQAIAVTAADTQAPPAGGAPAATTPPAPEPTVMPAPPSYPETVLGLESLIKALVLAIQSDDAREKARLLASLRLPDPEKWFGAHFDRRAARRLLAEYQPIHDGIGHLVGALKGPVAAGQTTVRAEEFAAPDQEGATGYQRAALEAMVKPARLYSVRLATADGKKVFHLWSFVHHEGTFRFVGKLRAATGEPGKKTAAGRDPLEYRESDRERISAAESGKGK